MIRELILDTQLEAGGEAGEVKEFSILFIPKKLSNFYLFYLFLAIYDAW